MKVTYKELPGKAEAGYGITRWPSAKEINESLKQLTDEKYLFRSERNIQKHLRRLLRREMR